MNYLPFAGYWFYGATSDNERAHYYGSYGLLGDVSVPAAGGFRHVYIIGGGYF